MLIGINIIFLTKYYYNVIMCMLAILNGGIVLQMLTSMDELASLTDEELVIMSSNSEVAITTLITRYKDIIMKKARAKTHSSCEIDDLVQEGLMALISAIMTFKNDYGTRFLTYANTCIENRMINSLSKNKKEDSYLCHTDDFTDDVTDVTPESILLEREKTQEVFNKITDILSDMEWKVFHLFLTGSTYDQMARQLNIPLKVVDNAMQRVRRKLKTVWRADNLG